MNVERAMNSYGCRSWLAKAGWLFFGTLLAIMLLGFESKPVYGQVEAGTVSGTVKDSTGAVVAGASVTAKNLATGAERSAQSSEESGNWGRAKRAERRQWSVQHHGIESGDV